MSLLHRITCLALVCLLSSNLLAKEGTKTSIDFTSESFEVAKDRALTEGKLLFVDFHASWCTPCKWMDATTFADQEVGNVLNENYVSIKVDIDTPAGFALKEKFAIKILPTMLIFNEEGELVERVQETLSRSKMLNLVNFHVHSSNSVVKHQPFNKSPNDTDAPTNIENPDTDLYAAYKKYHTKKSTYRVQIGLYKSYEQALTKVNDTRQQFFEEIIVLNGVEDGQVTYKVLMGKFGSFEEADSFKNILRDNYKINAIVY